MDGRSQTRLKILAAGLGLGLGVFMIAIGMAMTSPADHDVAGQLFGAGICLWIGAILLRGRDRGRRPS